MSYENENIYSLTFPLEKIFDTREENFKFIKNVLFLDILKNFPDFCSNSLIFPA